MKLSLYHKFTEVLENYEMNLFKFVSLHKLLFVILSRINIERITKNSHIYLRFDHSILSCVNQTKNLQQNEDRKKKSGKTSLDFSNTYLNPYFNVFESMNSSVNKTK